jgi:hypothetical protein
MFDEILQAVKEHFATDPKIAAAIPPEQQEEIHNEVATHIANGMAGQNTTTGSGEGLLGKLENEITSGSPIVNAIGGGLIGSLASKFGLGAAASGAIAASLPALLQKFATKPAPPTT